MLHESDDTYRNMDHSLVNDVRKTESHHVSYIDLAGPIVAALLPKELSLSLGCSVPKNYSYVPLTPWPQVSVPREKLWAIFPSGRLAKKEICSNYFVVMNLRTKEIDSRSPHSRERRHRKPILRWFLHEFSSVPVYREWKTQVMWTENKSGLLVPDGDCTNHLTFPFIAIMLNFKNWYGHPKVYYLIFM